MNRLAVLLVTALPLCLVQDAPAQFPPSPSIKDAKPGSVRVLATGAIRTPLEAVNAQAEQLLGKPVVIEYGSARGNLKNMILAGDEFEVAILLPDVDDELQARQCIEPQRHEIARVNVALGLRGEAVNLDVSTQAGLKQALLKARSVKYAPTGAALDTVKKILSTLQIAGAIRDSSRLEQEVPLEPGEYEINIYPLSEILISKTMKNLGEVMSELQVPTIIEAVVSKHPNDAEAARALIEFLQGPAIDDALETYGMEKGRVAGPIR